MESHRHAAPVDYPVAEQMPDSKTHFRTRVELTDVVARHLADCGVRAFTSSDQFVYWVQGNPQVSIAPDLYVVLGEDPDLLPDIWKTWEGGAPDLVIEVVSKNRRKDYDEAPHRYGEMGVEELIVFDPADKRTRVRWQLYRRIDGRLVSVEKHDGDRVWSAVLAAWLCVAHHVDGTPTVRVATGPEAERLVPTTEELAEARARVLAANAVELADKAVELADKDAELADKDAELADKDAELARLRRLLAQRSANDG